MGFTEYSFNENDDINTSSTILDDVSDDTSNTIIDIEEDVEFSHFGSFETDKLPNGDYFVKGDNYDVFKDEYYSPEETTYVALETPEEIDISPSLIEGIHIGEREIEDPDIFWSQHEKGGSLDSFKDTAAMIPTVREKLDSGTTMDELLEDSQLSECASLYFENKPEVVEGDGFFEFNSNGRHRILAAREVGCDIPVKVIGRRYRN